MKCASLMRANTPHTGSTSIYYTGEPTIGPCDPILDRLYWVPLIAKCTEYRYFPHNHAIHNVI